ncbi:MAG: hypothetical protein ACYDBW_04125 [Sulfuricaulis sp.]
MESARKKSTFTFRSTAVLFILSAVFELLSVTSDVPLFGAIRGGLSANIYHLVYVLLFLGLGVGLWGAKPWGYRLVFITTVLYTLDKLQLLLSRQTIEAFITLQMGGYENELQAQGIDAALIMEAIMLTSIVAVLCWWGFLWYAHNHRDYFQPDKS